MDEEGMSDEEMMAEGDAKEFMIATVIHAKTSAFIEMIEQIKAQ